MSSEDEVTKRASGILDGLNKKNTKSNDDSNTQDNTKNNDSNNVTSNILPAKKKVDKDRYNHYIPVWQNEKLDELSEKTGHSKSKIVEIALNRLFEDLGEE